MQFLGVSFVGDHEVWLCMEFMDGGAPNPPLPPHLHTHVHMCLSAPLPPQWAPGPAVGVALKKLVPHSG